MINCKLFPNEQSARGALNAAEATWVRPTYINRGTGSYVNHSTLPVQRLSEPDELDDSTWIVVADHPSMKGDLVDPLKIKRNKELAQGTQGQGKPANPKKK